MQGEWGRLGPWKGWRNREEVGGGAAVVGGGVGMAGVVGEQAKGGFTCPDNLWAEVCVRCRPHHAERGAGPN